MSSNNSSNSSKGKSGNTKQISPSKHWVFTLNNHTIQNVNQLLLDSSIERLSMQEETGESGTPHLQGYIEFCRKVRPVGIFKDRFKAHWEKCKNIQKAIIYTQKSDTRTGKQYFRGIKKHRPLKCLLEENLYGWQKEILDLVREEPNDRTVRWYWETVGNVGKSALVRFLCIRYGAILVSGKSADIKYQISQYDPQDVDLIIYDIPRTAQNYVNYTAIEEIKNGIFSSPKFKSCQTIINSPHVLCFANFEPPIENMSMDRWVITELE